MTARKDPDEVKVTLYMEIKVSDKRWRALMESHGRDMNGVVIGAHVINAAKTILRREFAELGFPQEVK